SIIIKPYQNQPSPSRLMTAKKFFIVACREAPFSRPQTAISHAATRLTANSVYSRAVIYRLQGKIIECHFIYGFIKTRREARPGVGTKPIKISKNKKLRVPRKSSGDDYFHRAMPPKRPLTFETVRTPDGNLKLILSLLP